MRFSNDMQSMHQELKQFLMENLYRHYRVHRMSGKARRIIHDLFQAFMDDIRLLPPEHRHKARQREQENGEAGRGRAVADYIAGMTDRYAITEHQRLFAPLLPAAGAGRSDQRLVADTGMGQSRQQRQGAA
jgi:dGTPase